jgi:flagellar basal-body rod protein FlgC
MAGVDGVRGLLRGLAIPASGLSAQRKRMDVIAMNIANAETTRAADGGPYQRQVIQLRAAQALQGGGALGAGAQGRIEVPDVPPAGSMTAAPETAFGVEVLGVAQDSSDGPLVYDPGHPDADAQGYVRYPNVELVQETVDLMDARRAYEANATVFDAMKSMLRRAIRI